MAAFRSELFDIASVINFYNTVPGTAFRIYAGTKPEVAYLRYEWLGEDKNTGEDELMAALQAIKKNPLNVNNYLLQIISKLDKRNTKQIKPSEYVNITFQLNSNEQLQPMAVGGFNNELLNTLIAEQQKTNQLLAYQMQKQAEEEAEEENEIEEEKPSGVAGVIGALLKEPEIKNLLVTGLQSLLMPKNKPSVVTNGIPSSAEVELQQAIEAVKLMQKDVPDIGALFTKLANMAKDNPTMFNLLVNQLRSME